MSAHVELGTMAAFAEGTLPADDALHVREHLATCRSCMAAYSDAVRYRAAWLANPQAFVVEDEFKNLADGQPHATNAPRRARPDRRRRNVLLAAAGIVIAAFGLLWAYSPAPTLGYSLPPALLEATRRASAQGLVLPGGEQGANSSYPELRSGQVAVSPELRSEVDVIVESYERGARDADASSHIVAALLAVGELDAAGDYAREGLRRHGDSVPFLVFAADASYRTSNIAGAEALLRRAAARAPRDPLVAFDLALVLRQMAREDEARSILMRVSKSRVPGLAARAKLELAQMR